MRRLGMRQPAAFMMSDHRDGQLMARVQQGFGGVPVHGSTGQRGAVRHREAVRRISEEKRAFGITPDGPRGPSLTLNPGLAWIAAQTAVPVIGFAWMGRRTRILPSWDAYRWPRLFDRGHIKVVGPFLVSPRDLSQRRQFTKAFTALPCGPPRLTSATPDVNATADRPSPSAGQWRLKILPRLMSMIEQQAVQPASVRHWFKAALLKSALTGLPHRSVWLQSVGETSLRRPRCRLHRPFHGSFQSPE